MVQQIVAMLAAAGVKGLDWPSLDAARIHFETWLIGDLPVVDRDRAELLSAMGVGGG